MDRNGLKTRRKLKTITSGANFMKYILLLVCCLIFSIYTIQTKHEGKIVLSPTALSWSERIYDVRKDDHLYTKEFVDFQDLPTSKKPSYSIRALSEGIQTTFQDPMTFRRKPTTVSSITENVDVKSAIDNLQKQNLVTSGKLFKGEKTREFPRKEIIFAGKISPKLNDSEINLLKQHQSKNKYNCDKWGVVTTIFEPPSEAVRRLMYRRDWCVVVAGDKGKPSLEVNIILHKLNSKSNFHIIILYNFCYSNFR